MANPRYDLSSAANEGIYASREREACKLRTLRALHYDDLLSDARAESKRMREELIRKVFPRPSSKVVPEPPVRKAWV